MNKCAFDRDDKCSALEEKKCDGCKFFKTDEDLKISRIKVKIRLQSLPWEQQTHILRKYYGRSKP